MIICTGTMLNCGSLTLCMKEFNLKYCISWVFSHVPKMGKMCNIFDLHQSFFVTLNFFYRKLYVRICFLHIQNFAIYKRSGKKRTSQKSLYIGYKYNFNIYWTLYWPSALCSSMARYSLASTSSLSLSSSSSHRVDTDSDSCCPDDTEVTRSCWVRFESYSWWVVSSIMSRSRDTEPCSRLLASVQKRSH